MPFSYFRVGVPFAQVYRAPPTSSEDFPIPREMVFAQKVSPLAHLFAPKSHNYAPHFRESMWRPSLLAGYFHRFSHYIHGLAVRPISFSRFLAIPPILVIASGFPLFSYARLFSPPPHTATCPSPNFPERSSDLVENEPTQVLPPRPLSYPSVQQLRPFFRGSFLPVSIFCHLRSRIFSCFCHYFRRFGNFPFFCF